MGVGEVGVGWGEAVGVVGAVEGDRVDEMHVGFC